VIVIVERLVHSLFAHLLYFGNLIKKETGETSLEDIQLKVIDRAKEKLFAHQTSASEIAYALVFKYPSTSPGSSNNMLGPHPKRTDIRLIEYRFTKRPIKKPL